MSNEIDLLLGVCRASDASYGQILVEKMPFMLPADQMRLRECMSRRSLLDAFLLLVDDHGHEPWFRTNAAAFLRICDLFGSIAEQHHDQLVERFIKRPADWLSPDQMRGLTASGPPLQVLLRSLETLRDYRRAAPRDDLPTRHADIQRLRDAVGVS